MKARIVYEDRREEIVDVLLSGDGDAQVCTLPKERVGEQAAYIDFLYDYFTAKAGDPGYFITDMNVDGTLLTRFTAREDGEMSRSFSAVACYGWNRGEDGILGIVTGMRLDFGMVLTVKDGGYAAYPRFFIDGDAPEEDIRAEYHFLRDGSYSAMAREYRRYQLTAGGCVPLKERVEADPRLKKSAEGISVRIRMGWKPAPSPVENQTPETEPPMHVACTFAQAGRIAEALYASGVRSAELCLVGWNYGGHDGRFPQIFPPDPRLGGEEKLRELIRRTKALGYNIVCHDDATAAYTIADCFDEEYLLKTKDGGLYARPYCWSGGRPYKICPRRQYERFEQVNQPKLKELGFQGIHYIDVITILPVLKCYDKNHPLTRRQSGEWYRKTMKLSRELFGGFSSESGYDFAAAEMDAVLYPQFAVGKPLAPLCDELVPFWQMVYHGIILYNPCTYTLNYGAKGIRNRLKYFELGGRPLVCFNANFASDNRWMGDEDMLCDTEEHLRTSIQKIQAMAEDYARLEPERYAFIESHQKLADGVYCTTYSNGTVVTVDYNRETFRIQRR